MFDLCTAFQKLDTHAMQPLGWSFLNHRDNDRVADRPAILANLCNHILQLNTKELERSQSRLSGSRPCTNYRKWRLLLAPIRIIPYPSRIAYEYVCPDGPYDPKHKSF